jgi:excisionase family DNA binding protein
MAQTDNMTTGSVGSIAMTVDAAARETGISRSRLFDFIRSGQLPSIKVGRRRLVLRDDVRQFLAEHRVPRASNV